MRHTRPEPTTRWLTWQTVCDACSIEAAGEPDAWHHFACSHGDWGNDSLDSVEYFDACCWECYVAIVRREFDNYDVWGRPTLEIDGKGWHFLKSMLVWDAAEPPA